MSLFRRAPTLPEAIATVGDELRKGEAALTPELSALLRSLREREGDLLEGEPPPRLAELLDSLPQPVAVLGPAGRVVAHNGLLVTLAGPAQGRTLLELTRSAELSQAVSRAQQGVATRSEIELPAQQRLVHAVVHPLSRGRALVLLRDLSEVKRSESMRRDFIANASHELRTPVTAISGAVETLLSGGLELPEPARGLVEMISRHAARLARLSTDLLDLSRLEAGEWKVELTALDAASCCSTALDLVRARADQKRIRLQLLPSQLTVLADRRALEQVLVNLLDNAIKYTPEGGAVTVRCEPADGSVTLSIQDTGPGIEERHQKRVFERFYRIDAGRAREQGGAGLGLSIVKHLVLAQGGDVGLESGKGGSRFWVRLRVPERPHQPS